MRLLACCIDTFLIMISRCYAVWWETTWPSWNFVSCWDFIMIYDITLKFYFILNVLKWLTAAGTGGLKEVLQLNDKCEKLSFPFVQQYFIFFFMFWRVADDELNPNQVNRKRCGNLESRSRTKVFSLVCWFVEFRVHTTTNSSVQDKVFIIVNKLFDFICSCSVLSILNLNRHSCSVSFCPKYRFICYQTVYCSSFYSNVKKIYCNIAYFFSKMIHLYRYTAFPYMTLGQNTIKH